MLEIRENPTHDLPYLKRIELTAYEGETQVCEGVVRFVYTRYGDDYVKTMTVSGVATPLEHRRRGYVRHLFARMYELAAENGAVLSLLHPFSFSYYRKFGYGKVADHLIARCPIRLIDFVPRCCELVKYTGTEEQLQDLVHIYNTFSQGRQLMLRRFDNTYFSKYDTYIRYEDGQPVGYISYTAQKTLYTNHYEDGLMSVKEMAYTSPSAMKALLGFIRMYEGELDDVEFANIAMCPEVERALQHYTHTRYQILPDIMGRILDTQKLLEAHRYPKQPGSFRLRITDTLPAVNGAFRVEYGNGQVTVERLAEDAEVDLIADSGEAIRMLYGYDAIGPREAAYSDNVTVCGNADDFFRAFPKAVGGMYEHF